MNCAAFVAPSASMGPLLPTSRPHGLRSPAWPHTVCDAVERLEVEKIATIDEPCDHFAHIDRLAIVNRHHTRQFIRRHSSGALKVRGGKLRQLRVPRQFRHDLARDADAVGIICREIVAEPRNRGMHLRAAKLFVGCNLARRGAQQRRPGQKDFGFVPHQDHIVGQVPADKRRPPSTNHCTTVICGMPAADMRA